MSDVVICPVTNEATDKKKSADRGYSRKYQDTVYYMCCEGCLKKFESNPEKYTSSNQIVAKEIDWE